MRELFNELLPKLTPGIPLYFDKKRTVNNPLIFSSKDCEQLARLVIGHDTAKTFNVFTFVNCVFELSSELEHTSRAQKGVILDALRFVFNPEVPAAFDDYKKRKTEGDVAQQLRFVSQNADLNEELKQFAGDNVDALFYVACKIIEVHKLLLEKNQKSSPMVKVLFKILLGNESHKDETGLAGAQLYVDDCLVAAKEASKMKARPENNISSPDHHVYKNWYWGFAKWGLKWGIRVSLVIAVLEGIPYFLKFAKAYRS